MSTKWRPSGPVWIDVGCFSELHFRSKFATSLPSSIATRTMRKPLFYTSGHLLFASIFHHIFMLFQAPLLVAIFFATYPSAYGKVPHVVAERDLHGWRERMRCPTENQTGAKRKPKAPKREPKEGKRKPK